MKSDEQAFPDSYNFKYETNAKVHRGLTKREYFAAMAMQGYCANPDAYKEFLQEEIAEMSVDMSDKLLKKLSNETNS